MQAMVLHLPYGFLSLTQGRLYRLIALPSLQFSRLGQKTSFIPRTRRFGLPGDHTRQPFPEILSSWNAHSLSPDIPWSSMFPHFMIPCGIYQNLQPCTFIFEERPMTLNCIARGSNLIYKVNNVFIWVLQAGKV